MRWLLALSMLAGCVGAAEEQPGADCCQPGAADAAPGSPDAPPPGSPDAAPGCAVLPAPGPAWLRSYLDGHVAALAASPRASASQRTAARTYLTSELSALGYTVELNSYSSGANVWARLDSDLGATRTIVVGAHFDSVSGVPGANDNATGVAMVLALARYLRDIDCRTHDVIFALFDEEEVGLVGSYYFATYLFEHGVDVAGVHTIDQMGWDADGDRAIELERADPGMYELYAAARADLGLSMPLTQTTTGATDHVRFRELGFDAIGLTEEYVSGDTTPHYHQPGDTYDTVNLDYTVSSSTLLHHVIARAVRAPAAATAPRRVLAPPPFRAITPRGHDDDHHH